MYNDKNAKDKIDNLESKGISIVNAIVTLASQGYLVNKAKYYKLSLANMLLNAYENINVFSEEQQCEIDSIYKHITDNKNGIETNKS